MEDMHIDVDIFVGDDTVISAIFSVEIETLSMFANEMRVTANTASRRRRRRG